MCFKTWSLVIKTTLCSVHCKVPVNKNYILHEPGYQDDTELDEDSSALSTASYFQDRD